MIKDKDDLIAVFELLIIHIKPEHIEAIYKAQIKSNYCWLQCGNNAQIQAQTEEKETVINAVNSINDAYVNQIITRLNK